MTLHRSAVTTVAMALSCLLASAVGLAQTAPTPAKPPAQPAKPPAAAAPPAPAASAARGFGTALLLFIRYVSGHENCPLEMEKALFPTAAEQPIWKSAFALEI